MKRPLKKVGVYVWRTRELSGFNGLDGEELEWHEWRPLLKALMKRHKTDAHVPMYEVPGEKTAPRINKASLEAMRKEGLEPVLRVAMVDVDNKPIKIKKKGKKQTIKHPTWEEGGHPGITKATDPESVVAALRALYPSAGVYTTKRGLRLVWVLDKPVPVSKGDAFLTWLVGTVPGADPACTDWTRCFRLPFVRRDGVDTEAVVDFDPLVAGATLEVPDLSKLAEHVPAPALAALAHDAPDKPDPPPAELWRWIPKTSIAGEHRKALKKGKALAGEGERNNTLFQVIRSLGHRLSSHDKGLRALKKSNDAFQEWLACELYAFVYRSVGADTSAGAPTLAEAWGMCVRTAALEAGRWVKRQPALVAARAIAQPDEPEPDEPPDDPEDEWAPDPANPILVKVDSTFYVRHHRTGEWSFGIDANTVPAMLRDYQPRAIASRTPYTVISGAALVNLYGVVGKAVVYDMGLERTRWDPDTLTMQIACCNQVKIKPKRHADVAEWLMALGGEREGALLDWLATANMLESPTSCLYIEGPKDVGKGMLAAALGKMYGAAPVNFHTAISRFNVELMTCPIVWINEGIESSPHISAAFRDLITEGHRKIEQKYQPSSRIEGCVRVVICANNSEAIKLSGRHTRDDVDAIKQRIFHLPTDDVAANYLRALGGRAFTEGDGWVTRPDGSPGKICEHIAWLQANRHVERGKRLLVEGPPSDYHRRLLSSSSLSSQVLWAVAEGLLISEGKSSKAGVNVPGIRKKRNPDGSVWVWVNVSALHSRWKVLVNEDVLKPERAEVAAAVRSMSAFKSSKRMRVKGLGGSHSVQCWAIDPELVLDVADDFGLEQVDDLRKLLKNKPS